MMADSSGTPSAILIVDDDELLRTKIAEVQLRVRASAHRARSDGPTKGESEGYRHHRHLYA